MYISIFEITNADIAMQILVNETPFVKNQSVVRSRVKANTSFTNTNVVINSYLNTARLWVSSILAKRCNSHYLLYKWKVKSTIHVMSQFDTIMWTSFFFLIQRPGEGGTFTKGRGISKKWSVQAKREREVSDLSPCCGFLKHQWGLCT